MGVLHFAGLGKSPGAVTSGLSYLKHEMASSFEDGDIVEGVVIFTSEEIASGKEEAFPVEHNEYGQRAVRKTWTQGKRNAVDIVSKFLQKEFGNIEVYVVQTDVNDFSRCFESVTKAILWFHSPGKVGKHIWSNLTGGTNVLNAALIQAAYLSGLIPKLYYTFVANLKEDGKCLQPFSRDENEFDYREIYVLPTTFDERYRYLLEELSPNDWITKEELLSRLKRKSSLFEELRIEDFTRNYLNVWPGIQRKGTRDTLQENAVRLSSEGQNLLDLLKLPWFKVLLQRSTLTEEQREDILKGLSIRRV